MCHTDQEKKFKKKPRETETDTGCFRIKKYRRKNVWLKFQSANFLLECSAKYIIKKWKKESNLWTIKSISWWKKWKWNRCVLCWKVLSDITRKKNNSISRGIHLPKMVMTQIGHFYKDWSEKLVTIVGIGHKMVVLDYCNGQANDLHCISWSKWFLKVAKLAHW